MGKVREYTLNNDSKTLKNRKDGPWKQREKVC